MMQPTILMSIRSTRPRFHSTFGRPCGKRGFSLHRGSPCAVRTARVSAPTAELTGTMERANAFLQRLKADGKLSGQSGISFPEAAYN